MCKLWHTVLGQSCFVITWNHIHTLNYIVQLFWKKLWRSQIQFQNQLADHVISFQICSLYHMIVNIFLDLPIRCCIQMTSPSNAKRATSASIRSATWSATSECIRTKYAIRASTVRRDSSTSTRGGKYFRVKHVYGTYDISFIYINEDNIFEALKNHLCIICSNSS